MNIRLTLLSKRCIVMGILAMMLCVIPYVSHAHTYRVPVLVDTDMALDDMRAITMLLNSHMVDVPLIVVTDGISSPQKGLGNLKTLLSCLNRNEINVAVGKKSGKPAPPCRSMSENIKWPEGCPTSSRNIKTKDARTAIMEELNARISPVIYLCLGPMTQLAGVIQQNSGIKSKISRIVYFGDHPQSADPGWNTARDPEAAARVFASGMEIYCIHPAKKDLLPFDRNMLEKIDAMGSPAAQLVSAIHSGAMVQKAMDRQHLMIWDENTVIYLENPELFKMGSVPGYPRLIRLNDFDAESVARAYTKFLGHPADAHLDSRHAVVLKMFPHDPTIFKPDVTPHVSRIIREHGVEEWKATVLTNELHRHLGIYSLIGAKMGVRAREILGAPFDALKVVSHAGGKPPLSCMNDGLQVSTGASLGRGAIEIESSTPRPEATFLYQNKSLTLTLKPKWRKKTKTDIKRAIKQFGGLNKAYFAYIRKLSIKYWHDFNRGEIFDEKLDLTK